MHTDHQLQLCWHAASPITAFLLQPYKHWTINQQLGASMNTILSRLHETVFVTCCSTSMLQL